MHARSRKRSRREGGGGEGGVESLGRVRAPVAPERGARRERSWKSSGSRVRPAVRRYRCIYASDYASVSQRSPPLPSPRWPSLSPFLHLRLFHHRHHNHFSIASCFVSFRFVSFRFVECLRERTAVSLFDGTSRSTAARCVIDTPRWLADRAREERARRERTASGNSLVERHAIQPSRHDLSREISNRRDRFVYQPFGIDSRNRAKACN